MSLQKLIARFKDEADQALGIDVRWIEIDPADLKKIIQSAEVMAKALARLSNETKRIWVPCGGSHSLYSSMHPMADVSCPICGESEDSLGRDICKDVPTENAKLAREAKAQVDKICGGE